MLRLACPWCGLRDEIEFCYGGEAHIALPPDAEQLPDTAWADYLFMRTNPKGRQHERWVHTHGCRRWFNVVRDTATERIFAIYPTGSRPPDLPDEPA
jgi:heterotetrameric sarcosine oxidase delta subunit